MNAFFIYMVKTAIYLSAFYIVYASMLSMDTTYGRNRSFILVALAISLILPYFTLETLRPLDIQVFGKLLSEVFVTANVPGTGTLAVTPRQTGILQVVYTVYLIGTSAWMIKLLFNLANLLFLIARQKTGDSRIIRFHGFNTAGFSAMGYIFINTRLNPEEAGSVIRHEQNHLKKNHFADIVFIEIIKALQWFNPVVYLFDRSLRAVHEFQADKGCISSGIPVVNYQSLLLSQVFKSGNINLTNSFSNPSLIRRRMIMMTKKRTSSIAGIKLLAVIPVITLVYFTISAYKEMPDNSPAGGYQTVKIQLAPLNNPRTGSLQNPPPPLPPPSVIRHENSENSSPVLEAGSETDPFVVVEEMPEFPGGDAALLGYISANTTYPEAAKRANIQGRVIIRFCVTEEGAINRASILKGVSPELDAEALRVVKSLPEFTPGRQGGKAVPVWFSVPITFTLK
jgi:TonB family protein